MSKIAVGIGAALVVASGAALYVQHCDNAQLREEIAALRNEVRGSAARIAETTPGQSSAAQETPGAGRTPGNSEELTTLRNEIAALRQSTQEITKFTQMAQAAAAAKSLQNADNSFAVELRSTATLKNVGKATPEASTETVLWAAAGGEVDVLANSVVFTPSAKAKADAWFAGLSDATRQQYGSAENVMALMIAKDAATLSGMQVIGQKGLTDDDVGVRLRFANTDGKTKESTFVFHRANDGWRLLLPDEVVEKFSRQLAGKK